MPQLEMRVAVVLLAAQFVRRLHIVDELRPGVVDEVAQAARKPLLRLEVERVVRRVAPGRTLVDHRVVLREPAEGLALLLGPPASCQGNHVEVVVRAAQLVADIRLVLRLQQHVVRQLLLQREVPLLGVAVQLVLLEEIRRDRAPPAGYGPERPDPVRIRERRHGRQTVAEHEGRRESAIGRIDVQRLRECPELSEGNRAGVGAVVVDAVPRPNHDRIAGAVRQAEPRAEVVHVEVMRVFALPVPARERHHAGTLADGIDAGRIEAALVIVQLPARRVHIPAHPEIEREPVGGLPTVLHIHAPIVAARVQDVGVDELAAGRPAEQQLRESVARRPVVERVAAAGELVEVVLVARVAVLQAPLDAVRPLEPRRVVDHLVGPDRLLDALLVARSQPGVADQIHGGEEFRIDVRNAQFAVLAALAPQAARGEGPVPERVAELVDHRRREVVVPGGGRDQVRARLQRAAEVGELVRIDRRGPRGSRDVAETAGDPVAGPEVVIHLDGGEVGDAPVRHVLHVVVPRGGTQRPWVVRRRVETGERAPQRIHATQRNRVVLERNGVAGVHEGEVVPVREIAADLDGVRHVGIGDRRPVAAPLAFVVEEEERLVLLDRPSERTAEDVVAKRGDARREERARVQGVVAEIVVERTVEIIGPRPRAHDDQAVPGAAEFGGVVVGLDLEFPQRFNRRVEV